MMEICGHGECSGDHQIAVQYLHLWELNFFKIILIIFVRN